MNFQPHLAELVMSGRKTVTRRLVSGNERSPWFDGGCSLKVGRDYAICPGRGKDAIGRVKIKHVRRERLGMLTGAEAYREGFGGPSEFQDAFKAINGSYDADAIVWRIEFEVATSGREQPHG